MAKLWKNLFNKGDKISASEIGYLEDGKLKTVDEYLSKLKIEEGKCELYLAGNIVAGSHTYSTRTGEYTRLGNRVRVTGRLDVESVDTGASGIATIIGLPFAIKNNGLIYNANVELSNVDLGTGYTESLVRGLSGSNFLSIIKKGSNRGITSIDMSALPNSTLIRFTIEYDI